MIEIAESSVGFDQSVKAALYARAGVYEYWLIDLARERVHLSHEPEGGRYRTVRVLGRRETLTLPSLPQIYVTVEAVLGD